MIRYPKGSIIVNAGIFVNIARPKNIPEINRVIISLLFLQLGILLFLEMVTLPFKAKNIDRRIKGN
jgi:hypothetical protein